MSTSSHALHHLLYRAFVRLNSANPKFSLRLLAQKVEVSHSYLSKIFNGKAPVTKDLIEPLCDVLKIDEIEKTQIYRTFSHELLQKELGEAYSSLPIASKETAPDFTQYHHCTDEAALWLIRNWYHIAIMDFIDCVNFRNDKQWIAQRLQIKEAQVENTITRLIAYGFVAADADGKLSKTEMKVRIPTLRSSPEVRAYHQSHIENAVHHLKTAHSLEDYQARLISGVSFSADPAQLEKAKQILNDAIYAAAELLASGHNCTEVYQINLQLFPLTKPSP